MKKHILLLFVSIASLLALVMNPVRATAQAGRQGAAAPLTPKAAAGLDLTGTWVPIISEDWRYRMVTPQKGDYTSVPLTAEARKVADSWNPAKDEAAGEQCKSYGAPAIMRMAGRIRIRWESDDVLRVDTEAGTQTRMLRFGPPAANTAPSWQGSSVAQWEYEGNGRSGQGARRRGHLKVVTTNLKPGYLRKNGVPYSSDAVLTEYYNRLDEPNGISWLILTTMVDDPKNLRARFATSTHFKKLPPSDTKWTPEACTSR